MKLKSFTLTACILLWSTPTISSGQLGTKIWQLESTADISVSPTVGPDGTIYVPVSWSLWALNPDGSTKWTFSTGYFVFSSPAIGDDCTIYFGSGDRKLYAVYPDGRKKWEFDAGSTVFSSPSIGSDGTIYFGTANGTLVALKSAGSKMWSTNVGGEIRSSPAIGSDGAIYIGSENDAPTGSRLFAVNPDGTKRWDFVTVSEVASRDFVSSPAIGPDGTIYVVSSNNKLFAIASDGSKKWEFSEGVYDTFNISQSSPAIGPDNTIYFCTFDTLYSMNPDGSKKWSYVLGNSRTSPIVGADGTIYVGYGNNNLRAISPGGALAWEFSTLGTILSAPALSVNGVVYFGTSGYPPTNTKEMFAVQATADSTGYPWSMFRGNLKHTGRAPDGVIRPHVLGCPRFLGQRGFELVASGDVGTAVNIETSTNLQDWLALGAFTNFNGMIYSTDSSATSVPHRFYRGVTR